MVRRAYLRDFGFYGFQEQYYFHSLSHIQLKHWLNKETGKKKIKLTKLTNLTKWWCLGMPKCWWWYLRHRWMDGAGNIHEPLYSALSA